MKEKTEMEFIEVNPDNVVHDLDRRLGKLHISSELFKEKAPVLAEILKDFVPLDVEHRMASFGTELVGMCKHFDLIERGQTIVGYDIVTEETYGKPVRFKFVRR